MKKILAIFMCIFLICAFPLIAFAEEEQTEIVAETSTTEEMTSEGEISGGINMPDITTEMVVDYIKEHFEEISVVVSLILTTFYNIRKHKLLNRSIATTNNNAIKVVTDSDLIIQEALAKMEGISSDVSGYKKMFDTLKDDFTKLLEEFRATEEEKQKLEKTLSEAMNCIKTSKLANVEFADELAQLLVLANIPNSKKDELYSRHIAAVKAISDTEVNTDESGKES